LESVRQNVAAHTYLGSNYGIVIAKMASTFSQLDNVQQLVGMEVFELKNDWATIRIIPFGATIQSFRIHLDGFQPRDIVLGYDHPQDYQRAFELGSSPYFGAIVGPVAGRINKGRFEWENTHWQLPLNEGEHHLHGGTQSFSNQYWSCVHFDTQNQEKQCLHLQLQSTPEISYPGIQSCEVRYTLSPESFQIELISTAQTTTIANPTQHSYFNLNGHDATLKGLEIEIAATSYLGKNEAKLPTGNHVHFSDGEYAALQPSPIGALDHAFVLTKESEQVKMRSSDGLQLSFSTNMPIFQVYVGGESPIVGKGGVKYSAQSGICFENQLHPDAVHHPTFPSITLQTNEKRRNFIEIKLQQCD
jgi:aldose 1-epimerase